MSRARIIPYSFRSSLLSRRHRASILRPPNIFQSITSIQQQAPLSAGRLGLHPNRSHLSLPAFAVRAFSTTPQRPSTSTYKYSISAAYSDKKHNLNLSRNVFKFDQSQDIVDPTPVLSSRTSKQSHANSGQDSFFVTSIGDTDNVAFGVVDGVGGWEESGIDPADFAHGLCGYMADAAMHYPDDFGKTGQGQAPRPQDILDLGYSKVMDDASIGGGGSTACIATLSTDGLLHVANLGDSGYAHMSPFRLNFHSPPQTHHFNTPFQLSKLPPDMLKQVSLFGGAKPYSELPKDSAMTHQSLSHGDVLVFATDGVWDNLSSADALRIITRQMAQLQAWVIGENGSAGVSPDFAAIVKTASWTPPAANGGGKTASINGLSTVLATTLTQAAKKASLDRRRDGPFAKEVQRLYPHEKWKGGKADDICVVVAVVMKEGV